MLAEMVLPGKEKIRVAKAETLILGILLFSSTAAEIDED